MVALRDVSLCLVTDVLARQFYAVCSFVEHAELTVNLVKVGNAVLGDEQLAAVATMMLDGLHISAARVETESALCLGIVSSSDETRVFVPDGGQHCWPPWPFLGWLH